MLRAKNYAISQYQGAVDYMMSLGLDKPIHIGETGWATIASSSYGGTGSRAADEYKEKLYYGHMRDWTNTSGMSCFYFEAFDEQWKDQGNALGSENHFGLINLKGEAKFPLWEMVDEGVFDGLTRNGLPITKTYEGDISKLMEDVLAPPLKSEMGLLEIATVNEDRKIGQPVHESTYIVVHETMVPEGTNDISYPSEKLKLNAWEGTCGIEMSRMIGFTSSSTRQLLCCSANAAIAWICVTSTVRSVSESLSLPLIFRPASASSICARPAGSSNVA